MALCELCFELSHKSLPRGQTGPGLADGVAFYDFLAGRCRGTASYRMKQSSFSLAARGMSHTRAASRAEELTPLDPCAAWLTCVTKSLRDAPLIPGQVVGSLGEASLGLGCAYRVVHLDRVALAGAQVRHMSFPDSLGATQ